MKKSLFLIALTSLIFASSAFARKPKPSKCVVKVIFKVERENNRNYFWCLGDWDEDGYHYFLTRRRFAFKNISEEDCNATAEQAIGQKVKLQFIDSPPLGFVPSIPIESEVVHCTGVAESVHSIKYRAARN